MFIMSLLLERIKIMLRTSKSRIASLLAFILVAALLICTMSVAVFAHDDSTSTTKKKTAWDKFVDWFDSDAGQVVGFVVAGLVLVGAVILVIWWIPKKDKQGKKDKKDKNILSK